MQDDVLTGTPLDISGSVPMSGARRHPADTDTSLVLTLYDQRGELVELTVARTRSNELFQEWLRRYDRYTPTEGSMGATIKRLLEMPDDEIDTSDIPETLDWSKAERGRFYRDGRRGKAGGAGDQESSGA